MRFYRQSRPTGRRRSMADVTSMAAVRQGRGDIGQANLEVGSTQQNRAEIGRQAAAGEIGTGAARGNGCETALLRGENSRSAKCVRVAKCGLEINHIFSIIDDILALFYAKCRPESVKNGGTGLEGLAPFGANAPPAISSSCRCGRCRGSALRCSGRR